MKHPELISDSDMATFFLKILNLEISRLVSIRVQVLNLKIDVGHDTLESSQGPNHVQDAIQGHGDQDN